MEPYLQFLRDWLPFGRGTVSAPQNEALRQWLDEFATAPANEAARKLAGRLPSLLAGHSNLHVRMRILDDVHQAARSLLPGLEDTIAQSALPLANEGQLAAVAADNLLKALAAGYREVVSSIENQRMSAGLINLLRTAIDRGIECLAARQCLAHRAYAPPSTNSWLQMHRLYATARHNRVHADPSPAIETHYVSALLIAFADPTKFSRADFPELCACVDRVAPLAVVLPATGGGNGNGNPPDGASFVVAPGEGRPGHRLARASEEFSGNEWIIDCTAVVSALRKEIAAMELSGLPAGNPTRLPLKKKLLTMWDGQPTRRFNRTRFKPRGELIIGLPDLVRVLGEEGLRRRRDDWSSLGTAQHVGVSEWIIADESPDGFGIRYAKGDVGHLEVGEIVGLRPRERNRIHVCIVRRMTNGGPGRFELGLQEISPTMVALHVGSRPGPATGALFFPSLPGFMGVPGLLALPGIVDPGVEVTVTIGATPRRIRIMRALEQNNRCELYFVQPA